MEKCKFYPILPNCRYILAKKVERPDVVMAIHPRLEGEFWGPTVDLLLDENIKVAFTAFNEEHFKQALERLDYVFAKYVYKVNFYFLPTFTNHRPSRFKSNKKTSAFLSLVIF